MCMKNPIWHQEKPLKCDKFYKIIEYKKPGIFWSVSQAEPVRLEEPGWYTPYARAKIEFNRLSSYGDVQIIRTHHGDKGIYSIGGNAIHGYYDIDKAKSELDYIRGHTENLKIVEVEVQGLIAYNKNGEFVCRNMYFRSEDLIDPNEE